MHLSEAAEILARETNQPETDCYTVLQGEATAMAEYHKSDVVSQVKFVLEKIQRWIEQENEWPEITPRFVAGHRIAVVWALMVARERK